MSNQKKAKNPIYLITLETSRDPGVFPRAICECGWASERDETFYKVGLAAKQHSVDNPGHILRPHGNSENNGTN